MRILFALILSLVFSVPVFAQNEITGKVSTTQEAPIPSVVIKVMNGKKIAGFAKSNSNGEFKIRLQGERQDTLELVADCLGYKQLRQKIDKTTSNVTLIMQESSISLKEVTVNAPKVRQRGDTVRYRLGAFTGKSDQTLEDGLKRLPGVEVGETGKVSYQGKEISDFYVENQQLVGRNYGLVTKNMPAEYVTDVEFIENHQAAAMDKGKMSDDVALNIRLSNKAKFKPVGTAAALAGFQRDRALYRAEGTGMMFSTKFQTMLTLKGGDFGKDNIFSPAIIMSESWINNYPSSAIGSLTGTSPPLRPDDYAVNSDASASVNFLRSFTSTKTMRVNAGYNYERSRNYYAQSSIYAVEADRVEFSESGDPQTISHLPYLNFNYTLNDSDKYVTNDFVSKFDISDNRFNLTSEGRDYFQQQKIRALTLSDNFSWRKRFGHRTYSFSTRLSYLVTPTAIIDISSPGVMNARQNASGHTLKWGGTTGFEWRSGNSRWLLPLEANVSTTRLHTNLDVNNQPINNIASTEANLAISPRFEYSPRNRRVELSLAIPVRLQLLHAANRRSEAKADIGRGLLNPILRAVYNPSSHLAVSLNSSINHSTGDVLDLLTNEIMTDFRTIKTSSGIIGKSRNISAGLKLVYKNAIDLFFTDASANYSRVKRNTINSLYIEGEEIDQGVMFFDNNADVVSTSAMISKQFYNLGINISVRGNYSWSKNHSYQQGELVTSYATTFAILPRIIITPLKFFELRYDATIGKTFTRFSGHRSGIFSMNNDVKLSIYPAAGWDVFWESSILRKGLSDGTYKDFALFNAGVTWKHKKYRFTLKADNILNTQHYSYSIFNGINIYSYDFRLTGRSIYLKYTFTI